MAQAATPQTPALRPLPRAAVGFVRDPDQARSLLDPLRRRILQRLGEPGSASTVADELALPRQRVNYHVRAMQSEGLLEHVEDRKRGNCVEKIVRATARRYVVDPWLLDALGFEKLATADRSFSYATDDLVASASRTLREVGELLESDPSAAERLPTLTIESHIHFRSPEDEVEFANGIREVLGQMAERYHDPDAGGGRTFRITVGGHLAPQSEAST